MGLNAQPSGERVHIGFFGLRNAGKSSVVNRVTGQTLSIVSDVKGKRLAFYTLTLGVQDLELYWVVLLVGRIRARDIAALGRLICRTVKAAERVRHIKRDRGTHPVSCQQWRFGFR